MTQHLPNSAVPPLKPQPQAPKKRSFGTVLRYVPRYRRQLVIGVACLIASQLLLVGMPQILRIGVRAIEDGLKAIDAGGKPVSSVVPWALLYVAVAATQGLCTFLMRRRIIGLSRALERDLKRDVFAHVARLPFAFFDRMRTGDLLSRLTSDVEAVRFSVGPGVMYLGQTAIKFPVALAAMLWMDWRLTLILLLPLTGVALIVRGLAPSILKRSRAVQDRIADLSARAQENFAGARVVRAYATEDLENAAFRAKNNDLLVETLGLGRRRSALSGSLRLMGDLGILAVLWFGGHQVLNLRMDIGTLFAFLSYGDMLLWPMISLGYVLASFQRAVGAMNRIDEILAEPVEASDGEPSTVAGSPAPDLRTGRPRGVPIPGAISVRHLTFAYPGAGRAALSDVSVEIPAGSTLAVVGPIGSGKSTLVSLLVRLYETPEGAVFLDGTDVKRMPLPRLRASFAFVPQDGFLFSDTVRENLSYGLRGAPDPARVERAAAAAGLSEDIAVLPHGLDTVVGERGITLSGGQKQRATIARALLVDGDAAGLAPILVLDDALSSVDTRTEAKILDGLASVRRERTTILVAHRLSTVRDADQILVLDAGRVVEHGTHDSLLQAGGWYARTYGLQRLHAEIESLA